MANFVYLQHNFHSLFKWFNKNSLFRDIYKIESMPYMYGRNSIVFSYVISDTINIISVHDLGIIFNQTLSFYSNCIKS